MGDSGSTIFSTGSANLGNAGALKLSTGSSAWGAAGDISLVVGSGNCFFSLTLDLSDVTSKSFGLLLAYLSLGS
jgi:hypothetical protein